MVVRGSAVPQSILPHLHRRSQMIEQTCVPMSERMCRSIQTELLQDRFQLPLDEVVGMQATTFTTQEKWLLRVRAPDNFKRGSHVNNRTTARLSHVG
jgi:hypothetical protein